MPPGANDPPNGSAGASKPTHTGSLTPNQAHYLLRGISGIEIAREWAAVGHLGGVTKFGHPYKPEPVTGPAEGLKAGPIPTFRPDLIPDAAYFRGMYRSHFLTFPGIFNAPKKYWQERAQPWLDCLAAIGLSSINERGEPTKRMQINWLLARFLGMWWARGIRVGKGSEAQTLPGSTSARPGPRELLAIDNVFPGISVSPSGWYVGVIPAPEGDDFLVGLRKGKAEFVFSTHGLADIENLAEKVRSSDEGRHALQLPRTPYRGNASSTNAQIFLRSLLAVYTKLDSSSQQHIDDFFNLNKAELGVEEAQSAITTFKEIDKKLAPLHRAWVAAGKRVAEISDSWRSWTDSFVRGPEGLKPTWALLSTEKVTDLPRREQVCVEKASIWVAYFLFQLFVTGPNSKEAITTLRWIMALTPWWPLRQLLRIADPSLLIQALLAFALARPFGTKSLFHRLADAILGSQANACRREVKVLQRTIVEKVGDEKGEELIEALRRYVSETTTDERLEINRAAFEKNQHILELISEGSTSTPVAEELQRVLSKLSMARDYNNLIKFAGSSLFTKIIKDTMSVVCYEHLTWWARTCKLPDRVYDLQIFLTELLDTARIKNIDLNAFIKLTTKHQQKLYYLVHEADTYGQGLAEPFKKFADDGVEWMKTSSLDIHNQAGAPLLEVDLDEVVEKSGVNRTALLQEVDSLAELTRWRKMAWNIEMRRNILLQENALGLAGSVDIEKAMTYVTASLSESGHDSEDDRSGTSSGTEHGLEAQYSWAWMAEPGAIRVLERKNTGVKKMGSVIPRIPNIHQFNATFMEHIRPKLLEADTHTWERVKDTPACK